VNNQTASLIFDDIFKNYAAGMNPNLTLRKLGMRNLVATRIALGLSPYPPVPVNDFVTDKFGGFVDQSALRAAQASLGITNTYDSDPGTFGCPTNNAGTIVTVPNSPPPQLKCSASYSISNWYQGLTAGLDININNLTLLQAINPLGWTISFTATGSGSTPPFYITNCWTCGTVTQTASNGVTTYTLTNAAWNNAVTTGIAWNAFTLLPNPYNNIASVSINGVACSAATTATINS